MKEKENGNGKGKGNVKEIEKDGEEKWSERENAKETGNDVDETEKDGN